MRRWHEAESDQNAPVILALSEAPWAEVRVLTIAQHRQMLTQVMDVFGIVSDIDMSIRSPNQSWSELTVRLLAELYSVLVPERSDMLLVQGDTTPVMTAAMATFYWRIDVGYAEMGLRTGGIHKLFPEEMNRLVAGPCRGRMSPRRRVLGRTSSAKASLRDRTCHRQHRDLRIQERGSEDLSPPAGGGLGKRLALVIAHRRKNFGEGCVALRRRAGVFEDRIDPDCGPNGRRMGTRFPAATVRHDF